MRGVQDKGVNFTDFLKIFSQEDYKKKDSRGRNILHRAAIQEQIGIVKAILKEPHFQYQLNEEDNDMQTALSLSLIEDKHMISRLLILNGCDVNKGGGKLGSPLHIAISKMEIEIIYELLAKGADPCGTDQEGNTPLHLIFQIFSRFPKKSVKIVEMLIQRKCDCNTLNKEMWAPIHLAVKRDQKEAILLAIKMEKYFNIHLKGGLYNWNIMHLSCSLGKADLMQLLMQEKSFDIFSQTKQNQNCSQMSQFNPLLWKLIKKEENYIIKQKYAQSRVLSSYNKQETEESHRLSLPAKESPHQFGKILDPMKSLGDKLRFLTEMKLTHLRNTKLQDPKDQEYIPQQLIFFLLNFKQSEEKLIINEEICQFFGNLQFEKSLNFLQQIYKENTEKIKYQYEIMENIKLIKHTKKPKKYSLNVGIQLNLATSVIDIKYRKDGPQTSINAQQFINLISEL